MKQFLRSSVLLLSSLALAALAREAGAFPNSQARVQLHLTAPDLTASCSDLDATKLTVSDLKLKGIGGPWMLWVLVSDTRSLNGVGFSISADPGVHIVSWYSCADMEFPLNGWPQSGGSNTIVWGECQQPANGIVPVGFFILDETSQGTIRIFPHERFNEIQLADCMYHATAVPDSGTAAVAVWPDSTSFRLHNLAWHTAKELPAPAEPDSVILLREAAARKKLVMPEPSPALPDSAPGPAVVDSTRGPVEEH